LTASGAKSHIAGWLGREARAGWVGRCSFAPKGLKPPGSHENPSLGSTGGGTLRRRHQGLRFAAAGVKNIPSSSSGGRRRKERKICRRPQGGDRGLPGGHSGRPLHNSHFHKSGWPPRNGFRKLVIPSRGEDGEKIKKQRGGWLKEHAGKKRTV